MNAKTYKDQKRIDEFLEKLDFTVTDYCPKCNKRRHYSKFVKYIREHATGEKYCPICNTELKYY